MKTRISALFSALVLFLGCWTPESSAQLKSEVVGLTVCRAADNSEYAQAIVPGLQVGTQIYLLISAETNAILRVADSESPSVKIMDSNGQELEVDDSYNTAFFAQVSEDKKSIIVPLLARNRPGAGTTNLTIKGTVEIVMASDLKTETIDATIESGEKIKLGAVEATIKSVESGFSPDSQSIELESESAFDQLESVEFIGSDGQEIKSNSMGGGSFGFGDKVTYSKAMQLEGNAASVKKIRVKYFAKTESAKVSVDTKVDLSLGGH